GYSAMGAATQERIQIPIHDTHIVENASWFRGAHSVKFGGEVRLARNVDDLNSQISGALTFGDQPSSQPGVTNTGNAIASLLLGFPSSASILDTDLLDRRAKYFALFVHDDWKVSSRFTLNLGVRWETALRYQRSPEWVRPYCDQPGVEYPGRGHFCRPGRPGSKRLRWGL